MSVQASQKLCLIQVSDHVVQMSESDCQNNTENKQVKVNAQAHVNANSETLTECVVKYPEVFHEGIGKMRNYVVKFHVDPTVPPVAQAHRRIPFHIRWKVEDELTRLEELDIIERVSGPTPWVLAHCSGAQTQTTK